MIGYKYLIPARKLPEELLSSAWFVYPSINSTLYETESNRQAIYISPSRLSIWFNGRLTSHLPPASDNHYGIYCTKAHADPELIMYQGSNFVISPKLSDISSGLLPHLPYPTDFFRTIVVENALVELYLEGIIIEGEHGYRAQYAEVIRELSLPRPYVQWE